MNHKSSHDLIRNTYNFQTLHQKQTKQLHRKLDRVLIQPINLNTHQKFTHSIQQMQSKIEGVENLMKLKANQVDPNSPNRDRSSRNNNIDYQLETNKLKIAKGNNLSAQDLLNTRDILPKSYDNSPTRKSYRLPEPKKYADDSPIKIPPLNLHSINSPPSHSPVYQVVTSPTSTNTSPSPPRRTLSKFYQSRSFMELPTAEAQVNLSFKLNGSFLNFLNQQEKEKSQEISLFNFPKKNSQEEKPRKASKDLSFLNIKNTMSKIRNRSATRKSLTKLVIQGYQFGKILGKGKFGQVFLAKHLETGFLVAIKKIVKKKLKEYNMVNQFINEIKLHITLDHPTIVKLYGLFEEQDSFYLVMEYVNGGTLFDFQNQVGILSIKQTAEFLKDVIDALLYLHQRSIAHRDIKPENIVITSAGTAKLCDFGWSTVIQSARSTFCGTLDYAPPEIIERKTYDCRVDLWCIGILAYELLIGKAPFESDNRNEVMDRIINIDKCGIPKLQQIPNEGRQFIEALLQKDPAKRPKINQLLDFSLFNILNLKQKNKLNLK